MHLYRADTSAPISMELASSRVIAAPPAEVWQALNDPTILKASVPGCESLQRTGDNAYQAVVTARVGPVSAKFNGRMTMTDIDAPNAYTLRFEGQGGVAGFANGEAQVTLAPADGNQTTLTYKVKAQVGGKLAQIGSRLIDGAAAKLADDFFARFGEHFAKADDVPEDADAPNTNVTVPVRVRETGTWTRFLAIAAIIVILAILYFKGGRGG